MAAEVLEVRPRDSRCDCGTDVPHELRTVVLPDGLIAECLRCRRRWVECHEWPKAGSIVTAD